MGVWDMEQRLRDLRSKSNPKARIKIMEGHFATSHSHINMYIDMSTVKCRHNNARETAKELASRYVSNTSVDTIICMDGTEVIGAFMAEVLADTSVYSMNTGKNISVVTPEFNQMGQMIFRDNTQRMIANQQVLLLVASATTGKTIDRAVECIEYYKGQVCGIAAIFSAAKESHGMKIQTIFTAEDVPEYHTYSHADCPYCRNHEKIEAIVNSYGYSKL